MSEKIDDWNGCAARLNEVIAAQPYALPHAVLRWAEWEVGERWASSGVVRLLRDGDPAATISEASHVYPRLRLSEKVLSGDGLVTQILAELRGRAGERYRYGYREREHSASRLRRPMPEWPYWRLRVALDERSGEKPYSGAVVAFGQPAWSDAGHAISAWLGVEDWWSAECRIYVPDLRARLADVRFAADGSVHVCVESSLPGDQLEVQLVFAASYPRNHDVGQRGARVTVGEPMIFQAPEHAETATAFVVTAANEVLDRIDLRRESVEHTIAERLALEEQCEIDLAAGEGEEIELKCWITPKDGKEHELLRTIVAFANTRGGRLYLGVRDHDGTLEGRGAFLHTFRSKDGSGASPDEAAETAAKAWLRKLVQDKLRRVPPMEVELVQVHGEPVLCVRVETGGERPYATYEGNEIFIRKGSNNRRPDPDTELPGLLGAHRGWAADLAAQFSAAD